MNIDEATAYFSGFFAADGHLELDASNGRRICFYLAAKDRYILEKFSELFGGMVRDYSYPRKDRDGNDYMYPVSTLSIWPKINKELFDWILEHDFKNSMTGIPTSLRRHFIRGFVDGDGHVSFGKRKSFRLVFCNASRSLIQSIFDHLKEVLYIPVKTPPLRKDNTYNVSYESAKARIIAWYLWRDATIFLPRKAAVVNKLFHEGTDAEILMQVVMIKDFQVLAYNNGLFFRLNAKDSKELAAIVKKAFLNIGMELSIVPYGKGKNRYQGIYIPQKYLDELVYMQGLTVTKLPSKVKVSEGIVHSVLKDDSLLE